MENNKKISFLAGVKYENKIFFSITEGNGLFSYDLTNDKMSFIGIFYKESISQLLHIKALLIDDEMWLIPFEADYITCVNLKTFEMDFIAIPGEVSIVRKGLCVDAVKNDHDIYVLPYGIDSLIKIDTYQHSCSVVYSNMKMASYCVRGMFVQDGFLNLIKRNGDIGVCIDLSSMNNTVFDMENNSLEYNDIFESDGNIYCLPYPAGCVIKKVKENDKLKDVQVLDVNYRTYFGGTKSGDSLILFPCNDNRSFWVGNDFSGKEIPETIKCSVVSNSIDWIKANRIDSDEGVWIATVNGKILDVTDLNNLRCISMYVSDQVADSIIKSYRNLEGNKNNSLFYEGNGGMGIKEFVSFIGN